MSALAAVPVTPSGCLPARQIRADVAGLLRPPERIPVSTGAAKYVYLRDAVGTPRPWSPDITPYMAAPLDQLGHRRYEGVVFAGPARTGKTGGLLGWVGHVIKATPGDMAIMSMTADKASRFSKKELGRMLRDSPEIRAKLSPSKHDDNIKAKYFRDGMVLYLSGPSDNELRAETLKYFALTDYDGICRNSGAEGSVFLRAKKRLQTMGSGAAVFVESSPGFEVIDPRWQPRPEAPHEAPPVADGILPLYNQGTRCRRYLRCPVCAERFIEPAGFDGFVWPHTEDLFGVTIPELTGNWGLACSANGCLIGEEHEQTVKRSGIWVPEGCTVHGNTVEGTPRDVPLASYWLLGPSAAYQSWRALLSGYLQARAKFDLLGDEGDLMVCHNTDMGTAYLPQAKRRERNPGGLRERAEDYERGVVPAAVRFLVAAVDIQSGRADPRFVVQVLGVGRDGETWVVDRFALRWSDRRNGERERVNPAAITEHWDELVDEVITRRYPLAGDPTREMGLIRIAIDSGGGASAYRNARGQAETSVTDLAYKFWRRLKLQGHTGKVRLVKGANSKAVPLIAKSYPDNRQRGDRKAQAFGDVPVYLLNVHRLKDEVWNRVGRETPGPGYMHWGRWLHPSFFDELTAETRTASGWECDGSPNESFDLYGYAAAMCYDLGAEKIAWDNPPPWAAPWDANSEVRAVDHEDGRAHDPEPLARRSGRKVRFRMG